LAASNGREALALCTRHADPAAPRDAIALVVTDLIMPEMGGRTLLHALKQRDPASKVLLLTGHPLKDEELKDLRALGSAGCLFKPLSLEQLSEAVAQALHAARAPEPPVDFV
jgi:CheY-like chemotaxis protein